MKRFKKKYAEFLMPLERLAAREGVELFLVGGILRDVLVGRERKVLDFDLCLQKGAIPFGVKLARELGCGFVVLDEEHGACRLVKKQAGRAFTIDLTDFRGKDLKEDLLHRDFTVNAIAANLKNLLAAPHKPLEGLLIDLYGGRKDLKAKAIRATSKGVFDEDPLRLMRAFSLAATLGFRIVPETLRLIKTKRKKLASVSCERIRDELFKVLESESAFAACAAMDAIGLLAVAMPEILPMRGLRQGPYHHLDVWRHSLETLRQCEAILKEVSGNRKIKGYLDEVISGERTRRALLKLSCLLHDVGKPPALVRKEGKTMFHGHERMGAEICQGFARRLKLSNDEEAALEKMVFWHLRPGYLADNEDITARARFRYFRDTAQEGLSTLLLSMADQRATRGPLTSKASRLQHEKVALALIREYFRRQREKKPPRLITGDDLIRELKLEPSPLIGKILAETEELQAIGQIKTKGEALDAARRLAHV